MRPTNPETLGAMLEDLHGLRLSPEDIARTQAMAAASLSALEPFIDPSLFEREPSEFEATLDALADEWEPDA